MFAFVIEFPKMPIDVVVVDGVAATVVTGGADVAPNVNGLGVEDPNVLVEFWIGLDGVVVTGIITLLVGFDPNKNFGCVSAGFEIGSCTTGLVIDGVTAGICVGVTVGVNAKPPRLGTGLFEEVGDVMVLVAFVGKLNVTVRGDDGFSSVFESLVCCLSLCCKVDKVDTDTLDAVTVDTGRIRGVDTTVAVGTVVVGRVTLGLLVSSKEEVSFGRVSWLEGFAGSVGFGLTTAIEAGVVDGTFKREVVVAVLKVTDVVVLKLTDVDKAFSFGFSVWSGFSMLLELLLTLSTSSFDSSPRKKLSIMASFDF